MVFEPEENKFTLNFRSLKRNLFFFFNNIQEHNWHKEIILLDFSGFVFFACLVTNEREDPFSSI